jgi:RNA polymerase sigma-70 factor (ECF subfamily)
MRGKKNEPSFIKYTIEKLSLIKEKSLEEKITLQQVGEMFNDLPEKQKAVIEAIYIEGKSQQEVADELNIPLGTVKSRTRLALQRLKDMLETHD